jgi:DNA-binding CsgD family transcriptional regulator
VAFFRARARESPPAGDDAVTSARANTARQELRPAIEPASQPVVAAAQLTPMEQACLRLVAKHLSSKEIAVELGIAKTSVDTYCNRARTKLGVSDRYEAARRLVSDQASASRHFPSTGPRAAPVSITVAQDVAPSWLAGGAPRGGRPLLSAAVMILATVLALAALLSGLRALEAMRPPWVAPVQRAP